MNEVSACARVKVARAPSIGRGRWVETNQSIGARLSARVEWEVRTWSAQADRCLPPKKTTLSRRWAPSRVRDVRRTAWKASGGPSRAARAPRHDGNGGT